MQIPLRILIQDPDNAVVWNTIDTFWQQADFNFNSDLGGGTGGSFASDTFQSESVTFKQIIKDLQDPAKLFTDYSRSFAVPASKNNNKLFKHYYNINIDNGVDARALLPCRIEMNGNTYKFGNINLEGVKMSNGRPMVYNIRFIGKLSELAKRFGQDRLSDLPISNVTSWDWGDQLADTSDRDIIVPLSSKSRRFLFDDVNKQVNFENVTNIAWHDSSYDTDQRYSIDEEDLVPAIKCGRIITEIENTYGFNFTGAIKEDYVSDLYMYMHKVDKQDDVTVTVGYAESWGFTPPLNTSAINNLDRITIPASSNTFQIRAKATGMVTGDTLVVRREGNIILQTAANNTYTSYASVGVGDITVEIQSVNTTGTKDVYLDVQEFNGGTLVGTDIFNDVISIGAGAVLNIADYMPNESVMDFLTTLIKFFNLILVVDNDLNVSTYHYDYYMSLGNVIDVSKDVILESYDVNKPNIFSAFNFDLEKVDTAINYGYEKTNRRQYGSLRFQQTNTDSEKLAGQVYKQKVKGSLIPVERISNLSDFTLTDIGYTYFGSVDGEEQQTTMVFTYVSALNQSISYYDGATVNEIQNFLRPQNSYEHKVGLHFGSELYEYNTDYNHAGLGLWSLFYRGITAQMFDQSKRNVTFNAYFSAGRLEVVGLNDLLIISNNFYRINSIDTNHGSGRTKLDLTLVGQSEQTEFEQVTTNVANDSSTDALIVVYMDSNGVITTSTISTSSNSNITHIGALKSFTHDNYTLS